jgi:hypothetical protein
VQNFNKKKKQNKKHKKWKTQQKSKD